MYSYRPCSTATAAVQSTCMTCKVQSQLRLVEHLQGGSASADV